jgi:hypothetical protein
MAKHVVNVTFEVDSKTGKACILRRKRVPIKKSPGSHREVVERTPLCFLMPQGQAPQEDTETLYRILWGFLRNPI